MDANTLLADPIATRIERIVSLEDSILIVVRAIQPTARCPQCKQPSSSLKSRYRRRLADLPWHNVPVQIDLMTRKFRCRNDLCPKKVFCERLTKVALPFARRTVRLNQIVELLAFALGARAGARCASELFSPIGKDVFLRMARRVNSKPETTKVRVLGVDDFAFRRGINYGTILVDLEKRKPIDLLPDRTAETLSAWLKQHPEIEIISRDRSAVYADAARAGAAQADQVADRWHLLKNLGDLLERFFIQHHNLIIEAAAQVRFENMRRQKEIAFPFCERIGRSVPARRQKLFDSIKELQSQGKTIRGIARELKIARNTVRKYFSCKTVPQHRAKAGKQSSVLSFAGYLEKRWREGERNGCRLWEDLKAQGFKGEIDVVRRFIHPWRKLPVGRNSCPVPSRGLAPRAVARLLLYPDRAKNESEREYVKKLCEISPQAKKLQTLSIGFQEMVKEKRVDLFDDWLEKVKKSGIKELQNWADSLLADEDAVRNALSSKWSNGQVEGQVNRLKTIKRQMYGRANFHLLRARVLHQA